MEVIFLGIMEIALEMNMDLNMEMEMEMDTDMDTDMDTETEMEMEMDMEMEMEMDLDLDMEVALEMETALDMDTNAERVLDWILILNSKLEQIEFDKYHGGPWDRGSADAYYGRIIDPHKYIGGTYKSPRVKLTDPDEIAAYIVGYITTTDRKYY